MLALAIILPDKVSYIDPVNADVAGMGHYDLRRDYDFRRAVEDIVGDVIGEEDVEDIIEDCEVTGYVDDGYLHSSSISC